MKCTITIDMDNAAFEYYPGEELARILRELAGAVELQLRTKSLIDANGNKCGSCVIE